MGESYQKLTTKQLAKTFKLLYKAYPKLLRGTCQDQGFETICGAITSKIVRYLRSELGVNAKAYNGKYKGRGTEFSGGEYTGHCWVELFVKVEGAPLHFIIDGAYAQFFPIELIPMCIKDKQRLTIFVNDPIAEEWYEGEEDSYGENCDLNPKLNLGRV